MSACMMAKFGSGVAAGGAAIKIRGDVGSGNRASGKVER